jgi:hypothetical protein
MKPRPRLRELAGKSWVHVGSAMMVMGGWAAFENRTDAAAAAVSAGLVQAAASAAVTFSLKTALEAMSVRLRGKRALFVPPTVTCIVVLVLLVAVHHLAGTQELWSTISIPWTASSAYAWIYTALLYWRSSTDRARHANLVHVVGTDPRRKVRNARNA